MANSWIQTLLALIMSMGAMILTFRIIRGRLRYVLGPLLGGIVLLAGCSLYHKKFDVPPPPAGAPYDFHIVQSDDFGSFWDLDAAQSALDAVADGALNTNLIAVVFIHGWHHNADSHIPDPNLSDFRSALAALCSELEKPENRAVREKLTGDPEFRVVGIYVGWRGRSLPGFLDFATAWWRKEAAERVGSGDVAEFLTRLQLTYERANEFDPESGEDPRRHFMGLVAIGHSFGGQVLLKSVAPRLEGQLIAATSRLADTTPAARSATEERELRAPVRGMGDLNVLLNPALEAYQFARIDALYHQRSYPRSQTPQLVIFSADNDRARQTFFPAARALTAPFRAGFRDRQQRLQWSRALGELEDQRTHALRRSTKQDTITYDIYGQGNLEALLARDFTGEIVFAGIELKPDDTKPRVPNSPVAVIYTHDGIIAGHSGIFKQDFRHFLGKYIAFIEGKSLAARFVARSNQVEHVRSERSEAAASE